MDLHTFIILMLIVLLAAVIHGVSGFAFGIVLVAFLPYLINEYVSMLSMVSLLCLLSTSLFAICYRKYIEWKWLIAPVLASVLFNFIAISILNVHRHLYWSKYLGVCLVLLGFYMIFFQNKLSIQPSMRNGLIAGSLGGIIGGFFSAGGPPAVIYFLAIAKNDKYAYLATTQAYFALICLFDFLFRYYYGMVQFKVQIIFIPSILCIMVGIAVGSRLLSIISPNAMKKLIYCIMIINGVFLMIK